MLVIAVLRQLLEVDGPLSSTWAWILSGSVAVGFFLAYRGALSEHRSAFVAEVLHRDGIDLDVIRLYNRSFVHQADTQVKEASDV